MLKLEFNSSESGFCKKYSKVQENIILVSDTEYLEICFFAF